MKSGNLKFLEPSGPLQACKWTALLPLHPRQHNLYAHKCVNIKLLDVTSYNIANSVLEMLRYMEVWSISFVLH